MFAGLLGAAGVALAAVAAHKVDDPALATAAQMLILQAAAAIAITGNMRRAHHPSPAVIRFWAIAAVMLLAGAALFAGDISARALAGTRLFPMAAPTGGSTMIAGWIVVAIAGILELRSRAK
ncbi:MAG: DUF423 domain-containing protein [Hyphomicrobiaceae bacterium]|nr:DUF423 domain-containing protein [Hyphomicrobiaceae bacterium]